MVWRQDTAARPAETGSVGERWPGVIRKMLRARGILSLYRHQAEAMDLVRSGRHVVVATPTASGKTLIYNLPVLESCARNPATRALYLFPLKALSQDQLTALKAMTGCFEDCRPTAAVYDGDTGPRRRLKIRQAPPNILMTNPEMLHLSLLAHHRKWSSFWRELRYVVVDEVHTYRGIQGCHFAQLMRRLQRVCLLYGADPTFVFSSATIGNPAQLVEKLTGLQAAVVDRSGAPLGRRHLVFVDPVDGPARAAIDLLKAALSRGLRTIVYTQSRKMTELIALWAAGRAGRYRRRISAYRAGYLPTERRRIESRLASGELLAVISTSALEMGIDIGHLDLCILVGYPGSVVATRQRGGRVGRSGRDSALILIGGDDALDQYVLRHPQEVIGGPPEPAVVHPDNPVIASLHLECAAAELPLRSDEPFLRIEPVTALAEDLEKKGRLLRAADGRTLYSHRRAPHRRVNLRGGGDLYQIVDSDDDRRIGDIDAFRVYRETHPGAVYLHRGGSFLVTAVDSKARKVLAKKAPVNYFTRVKSRKRTEIVETLKVEKYSETVFYFGRIKVTDHVCGYEVRRVRDRTVLDEIELDVPPQIFETQALWFTVPDGSNACPEWRFKDLPGGIHAVEHAVISVFPLLVMGDRNDIGGLAAGFHDQTGCATIFVYDGFPGGVGLCRQAFGGRRRLIALALDAVQRCRCEEGCPACVQSPGCGSGNRPLDKELAVQILTMLQRALAGEGRGAVTAAGGEEQKHPGASNAAVAIPPETGCKAPGPITANPPVKQSGAAQDSFGVLDLETQLSAAEAGGWHRADRMKISCAVLYDSREDAFLEYLEDQVPLLLERIRQLDRIVGFNIKRFDYRVLSAYCRIDFNRLRTLDILEDVRKSLGYRLSLNRLTEITLGEPKTADGLQALRWWKAGRVRELLDYCRQDVRLTRDLYLFGRSRGYLLFRDRAGRDLRIPVIWA